MVLLSLLVVLQPCFTPLPHGLNLGSGVVSLQVSQPSIKSKPVSVSSNFYHDFFMMLPLKLLPGTLTEEDMFSAMGPLGVSWQTLLGHELKLAAVAVQDGFAVLNRFVGVGGRLFGPVELRALNKLARN